VSDVKKVVLAYSGGLDTSVIVKWLQEEYNCEVVTFTADIGQGEEVEPARAKAEALGVKEIYIDDLREEYARDFVFPMFRANTIYEGEYLLGTSIARPLIAKRLIEIANETGADTISHGATGKGNDQVRFELGAYALKPGIKVIAPWREWDLNSRDKLMEYCEKHSIPVEMKRCCISPTRAAIWKIHGQKLKMICGAGLCHQRKRLTKQPIWISATRRVILSLSMAWLCQQRL
jgi:argininosuccinate synthase